MNIIANSLHNIATNLHSRSDSFLYIKDIVNNSMTKLNIKINGLNDDTIKIQIFN